MFFFRPLSARATLRWALAALTTLGLSACSSFQDGTRGLAESLTLYQPEVVQGNFVSKEQVEALQPGMTRLQVRDLLGSPLMASVFHGDRWDYVFTMKRQRVPPQNYRLTLFFQGDALERFEGDDMPSEAEFIQRISRQRKLKTPVLEASEEQLARFPAAGAAGHGAEAPAPQPSGSYPPLESGR